MIASRRMSMGIPETSFRMDDQFPSVKLKDITKDVDRRLFISVPKGDQVAKTSACIVGGQGSGKTVFLEWMVAKAHERYGEKRVHTIYTDDIRVGIDLLDDKPVQLMIIDDAMTNASSRQIYEQTDIIKVYNRSRHVFEDILKGKPGLIIYLWAWQRFGELDPSFRQGDVYIFKTGIAEPSEKKVITSFIGEWYTRVLWGIWDRINRGNNAAKSTSVGCVASMERRFGVGIYHSGIPKPGLLPPIVRHDDYFSEAAETEAILEKYREDAVWGRRVACWELRQKGKKQKEIAAELGVRQGYVSEAIRKVNELLKKK